MNHHRRRERVAGRGGKAACRCTTASPRSRSSACRTCAGARSLSPSSNGAAMSRPRISTAIAANPVSANFRRPRRIVFVDEIPKSPVGKLLRRLSGGRRIRRGTHSRKSVNGTPPPDKRKDIPWPNTPHSRTRAWLNSTASPSPSMQARQRADITLDYPPYKRWFSMLARDQLRLVFPRRSTRTSAFRIIVVAGKGEHFSSGGKHQGLPRSEPGSNVLAACLEHSLHRPAAPSR